MRRIYHQVDGKLVEGPSPSRGNHARGLQIIPDIAPYRIPGTDKFITSRAKHRAHLRSLGAEEVGNEKAAFMAQKVQPDPTPKEMQAAVREAIEQCRAGKGTMGVKPDPNLPPISIEDAVKV